MVTAQLTTKFFDNKTPWCVRCQAEANAEGWDVEVGFAGSRKIPGRLIIKEPNQFASANECLGMILHKAAEGSDTHKTALRMMGYATAGMYFKSPKPLDELPFTVTYRANHISEIRYTEAGDIAIEVDMLDDFNSFVADLLGVPASLTVATVKTIK